MAEIQTIFLIMSHKQSKIDNYRRSKPMSIFNSFDGLKDVFNEINNNEKIKKSPIIFIVTVLNIQPLSSTAKRNRDWRLWNQDYK